MPGMNQLGGAQTVTQTQTSTQPTEAQQSPLNSQSDAGLQPVPGDAVKGAAKVKRVDDADERGTEGARRERRSFEDLSSGRRRRVDGRTGAVIDLSSKAEIAQARRETENARREEVMAQNREAANTNRAQLEKALAGDLFARPSPLRAAQSQQERPAVSAVPDAQD